MPKAYWINTVRSVRDTDRLRAYAELAGPAIAAFDGRFLARGMPAAVYEAAADERTVVIEFPAVERAVACYESADYQAALEALGDGAVRDIRIVEGLA
ncbi:DUF1330 domain-containing protein [Egicoccus halophilus]|uniref:DUF1330 domain-containing protein n=1 Tax=Egicoccus halophilus TaxID=1670830 RepID=A0A8J3A9I8_9ACTN|nr:DUF1330 domain-containing protein [Egicoccus halophilus]GGI05538.1 hypothetical protein GCM10011354_14600 [Egicoccus halophilus]